MRKLGGIDLPTIQKFINLWFSLSLDLHGNEVSTNAASYFGNGLKGRAQEEKWADHHVTEAFYELDVPADGRLERKAIPMRTAMNEVLRDWYVGDCAAGVTRWNKILERHGMSDRLRLPDRKFNRGIGMFSSLHFDPSGAPLSAGEWERRKTSGCRLPPTASTSSASWPRPVYEPGKFANYIAPPSRGINRQPINFEYVRTRTLTGPRTKSTQRRQR